MMVPEIPDSKRCTKCGEAKTLGDFYRHRGATDGLTSQCKVCVTIRNNESRSRRLDKVREQRQIYMASRREETAAYQRVYREEHRDRLTAYRREYGQRRKAKGYQRILSAEESESARRRAVAYYWANRDASIQAAKDYRHANPEKARVWQEGYRARRAGSGPGVSIAEWLAILDRYGYQCLACGAIDEITMDHVAALSEGGRHEPSNVQPLCKSCNSRKRARTIDYRPDSGVSIPRQLRLLDG